MSLFDCFWLTADVRVVEGFRVLTLDGFQAMDGDNGDADQQSEMQLKQQLSPQYSENKNNKQTNKTQLCSIILQSSQKILTAFSGVSLGTFKAS